jgi:hypothetical protein
LQQKGSSTQNVGLTEWQERGIFVWLYYQYHLIKKTILEMKEQVKKSTAKEQAINIPTNLGKQVAGLLVRVKALEESSTEKDAIIASLKLITTSLTSDLSSISQTASSNFEAIFKGLKELSQESTPPDPNEKRAAFGFSPHQNVVFFKGYVNALEFEALKENSAFSYVLVNIPPMEAAPLKES